MALCSERLQLYQREWRRRVFRVSRWNEPRLKALVENLLANERVTRILIRPHPKNLWRDLDEWIAAQADAKLSRNRAQTVLDDLKGLDVVFGGNSSVLVDSVTAGVVGAYVEDLDHGSPDLHRFVAAGLIYPSGVNPDFEAMWRFYQRPDWRQTLSKFANIDEDHSTVLAEALKFIAERL